MGDICSGVGLNILQLRVDDILLRGLKWSKLLDPEKKGQWWISGDGILNTNDIEDVATTINKEAVDAQKLMQLAAAQRMNTDIRRAIFCIIMSSEDYLDAFEKLLRLDLTGKQVCGLLRISSIFSPNLISILIITQIPVFHLH